jgi:hypothetical protein
MGAKGAAIRSRETADVEPVASPEVDADFTEFGSVGELRAKRQTTRTAGNSHCNADEHFGAGFADDPIAIQRAGFPGSVDPIPR